jgi:hypothetical protein
MNQMLSDVLPDPPPRRRRLRRGLVLLARGPQMRGDPRSWAARAAVLAAALSAGASGVLYLALTLALYRIPFPQLWALAFALLLVAWMLHVLRGPPDHPDRYLDPDAAELGSSPFTQVERWRRRLEATCDDTEWFSRVVRARLVTLVGQRLRLRHGVRLADEPARAREILGDPLYEFLTEALPRPPTPHELDRLITRMEEI